MTMTVSEFENYKKSVDFLAQLRSIPIDIIQYYLESECGYIVRKPELSEKTMPHPEGIKPSR